MERQPLDSGLVGGELNLQRQPALIELDATCEVDRVDCDSEASVDCRL